MADVLCPECGMQNSAEEEFCSFCNAKLKPAPSGPKLDKDGAELPDWLQSLRSQDESSEPVSSQENPLPDWFEDLQESENEALIDKDDGKDERVIDSSTGAVGKEGESPDWLRDLFSDVKFNDEPGIETATNYEISGDENQWLSRINGKTDEKPGQSSDVPKWLSELEEISPQINPVVSSEESAQEPEKEEASQEEYLDELPESFLVEAPKTEIVNEEETGTFIPAPTVEHIEEEPLVDLAGADQEGKELSWLNELEAAVSDFHPTTDLPVGEDKPVSPSHVEQQTGDLDVISNGSLPPWLSESASEGEILETPEDVKEEVPGLTPAELPSWLQAMRPIEATSIPIEVLTGLELEKAEVAGPLAGLRGALPAEPDISQTQKPLSYTVKLQVSDVQQSQANLLEGMIRSEGETHPLPVRSAITTQHVLRIAIAFILFLSVLVPIITGVPQVGMPVEAPGISPSWQILENLATGAPVLLAIDYAPSFSGEMDLVTSSVVDHLMRRGAYLAIVSTIPTGLAQAERLIASASQEGNHAYDTPNRYANLGLIPGGHLGLLRFSEAPNQVLPRDILGKPVWNNQPLNEIEAISGFSLVVVATENPDTARTWIEQVQPGLKGIPLVFVVSAQAEPILRPYFEATPKQVQGLIGGLAGGVSYQSRIGVNGRANFYWPPFSLSMMFAGLLIVIGGLINLALAYTERRKEHVRNMR